MTAADTVVLLSLHDDPTRPGAPPEIGRVVTLAAGLLELGRDCVLVTRRTVGGEEAEESEAAGVRVLRLPGPPGPADDFDHLQRHLAGFVDGLVRIWPDSAAVVHAHGWASALAVRSALGNRPQGGGPAVVACIDEPLETAESAGTASSGTAPRLAKLEASVAAAADAVLVGNTAAGDRLARRGVPRRLLSVLPHPLSAPPPPVPAAATRAVAEIVVLASGPGTPSREDPAVANGLAVVHALGEATPVVLPAPPVRSDGDFWDTAGTVLDEVAVALHLAPTAVTGHQALAAMDRGVAVVASDVGAHRDIIENEVSGLLVDGTSPSLAVRTVRRLLEDPFVCRALGAAAQDRVVSRHQPARVAAEIVALHSRLRPDVVTITDADADDSGATDDPDLPAVDLRFSDVTRG